MFFGQIQCKVHLVERKRRQKNLLHHRLLTKQNKINYPLTVHHKLQIQFMHFGAINHYDHPSAMSISAISYTPLIITKTTSDHWGGHMTCNAVLTSGAKSGLWQVYWVRQSKSCKHPSHSFKKINGSVPSFEHFGCRKWQREVWPHKLDCAITLGLSAHL